MKTQFALITSGGIRFVGANWGLPSHLLATRILSHRRPMNMWQIGETNQGKRQWILTHTLGLPTRGSICFPFGKGDYLGQVACRPHYGFTSRSY